MPKEPGTYHRAPATRFSAARRLSMSFFVVVKSGDIYGKEARSSRCGILGL